MLCGAGSCFAVVCNSWFAVVHADGGRRSCLPYAACVGRCMLGDISSARIHARLCSCLGSPRAIMSSASLGPNWGLPSRAWVLFWPLPSWRGWVCWRLLRCLRSACLVESARGRPGCTDSQECVLYRDEVFGQALVAAALIEAMWGSVALWNQLRSCGCGFVRISRGVWFCQPCRTPKLVVVHSRMRAHLYSQSSARLCPTDCFAIDGCSGSPGHARIRRP